MKIKILENGKSRYVEVAFSSIIKAWFGGFLFYGLVIILLSLIAIYLLP